MTADKIQIGDWVYSTFCDKPCKVFGIEQYESGYASVKVTNISGAKDINSLSLIPLTPEILEKNGFRNMYGKSNAYVNSESEASYVCFSIGDYDYTSLWGGSDQDYVWITVKYVHQFQHALRLCGITREIII